MSKTTGTVIQVMGPVLDIRFSDEHLPMLNSAIEVRVGENVIVAEVAQHIGDNVVRCIAMSSTDGLSRGAEAGHRRPHLRPRWRRMPGPRVQSAGSAH